MTNISIKVGDKLHIAGVDYEVQHILSCKDCCLCNTRQCVMLDPAITCGEKTHLGFKTIGYNLKPIFDRCINNRKQYKNKINKNKQICKA